MKRNSKRTKSSIRSTERIFPLLFWKECHFCKQEFVREKGWQFRNFWPMVNGRILPEGFNFICSSCAPDLKRAEELVRKYEKKFLEMRPNPPQPPLRPIK